MQVIPTATRVGRFAVRYDWTGTAPFDVWLDGVKVLDGTELLTYTAQSTDGTTNPLPAIEITDATDSEPAQSEQFNPKVRIQWRGQSDADYYVVEQNIDASWTAIGTAQEDGSGYYNFESVAQGDGITAEFRVIPYDSRGYDGLPLYITHSVVCNPAPPAVAYSYSAGTGDLTVEGI